MQTYAQQASAEQTDGQTDMELGSMARAWVCRAVRSARPQLQWQRYPEMPYGINRLPRTDSASQRQFLCWSDCDFVRAAQPFPRQVMVGARAVAALGNLHLLISWWRGVSVAVSAAGACQPSPGTLLWGFAWILHSWIQWLTAETWAWGRASLHSSPFTEDQQLCLLCQHIASFLTSTKWMKYK